MTESVSRDLNKCPVCQTQLVFVKGVKPTGHVGIMAFHEGDQIPEGSEILSEVKNSYKKHCADRDCAKRHANTEHVVTMSETTVENKNETITTDDQAPEAGPENNNDNNITMLAVIGSSKKEKISIPSKKADEKIDEVPKVRTLIKDRKPLNVDISKRNRFAIILDINRAMRQSDLSEGQIKAIRMDLTDHAKDNDTLFSIGSNYVEFVDNAGQPVSHI